MDVYPRTRTWPYVVVVLLLFGYAVAYPQWRSGQVATSATWRDRVPRFATRTVRHPQRGDDQRVHVDFRPDWLRHEKLPLHPPVAERVTLDPESPLAAAEPQPMAFESREPKRFDTQTVAAFTSSIGTEPELPDPSITPLPSPGSERTSGSENPLELPSSDIGHVAPALPKSNLPTPSVLTPADINPPPAMWPMPVALQADLDKLAVTAGPLADWKQQVEHQLEALVTTPLAADPTAGHLDALEQLADKVESLGVAAETDDQRVLLRSIGYAIVRRCALWQQVHRLAMEQIAAPAEVNVLDLLPVLQDVETRVAQHPQAEAWRNYLMLSRLMTVATENWVTDASVRREAARTVLERLADQELTSEQRQMVNDRAIQELQRHLTQWAEQPIELSFMLKTVEQFEQSHSDLLASELIGQLRSLKYSRQPSASALARAINAHYRNANVRITIAGQLLNDLMPTLQPMQQEIRDTILGAQVVGQNQTWTDLRVQLLEDADRLHLRVHADGQTSSRTVSRKGPVRLWSRDQSHFQADKDLIVSSSGIYVTHATAESQGESKLLEVKTDFDNIPVIGWVIQQIARDEHRSQRSRVRSEVQQRVRRQATQQLDNSIHQRLTGAENKMDATLIQPLRKLELDPTAVEMKTSQDRLAMRFRLASDEQLAAYTPRPRALADNVLSVQLHESAANNLLEQLDLEDERVELELLVQELADKLKIDRQDIHEEIPSGVAVRLASDRPIQVEFAEDRVVVIVRISRTDHAASHVSKLRGPRPLSRRHWADAREPGARRRHRTDQ